MQPSDFLTQKIVIVRNSNPRASYRIGPVVGQGTFGTVRTVVHRTTGEKRAIKVIRKLGANSQAILHEVGILQALSHPNIVRIYEFYEDSKNYYIITEFCSGGELFDRIIANGNFSEATAAQYMIAILSVLAYCHERGFVHRDLKPENFMLDSGEPDARLKVIDFGCGKQNEAERMTERVGSMLYIAPEVIRKNYTPKCDIWSAGVNMYIMLCGYPPFSDKIEERVYRKILSGRFSFDSPQWDSISFEAKDLITKMLTLDPSLRISAQEALAHSWLKNAPRVALRESTGQRTFQNLKNFRAEQGLQKAAISFIVSQLITKSEREEMCEVFQTMDVDRSGCLSKAEVMEGYAQLYPEVENVEEEVDSIMNQVDADSSGGIDYNEFIAATINRSVLYSKDRVRAAFQAFDVDGNGSISAQDLMAVLGRRRDNIKMWEQIIQESDKDGDGVIDLKEFTEMMLSLFQQTNDNMKEHLKITHSLIRTTAGQQALHAIKTLCFPSKSPQKIKVTTIQKIEGLSGCIQLETLTLSYQRIKRIQNLETLSQLNQLDLSENIITQIQGLHTLTNLTVLNLAGNYIKELPAFQLEALAKLAKFKLARNRIADLQELTNLQVLPSLECLWVRGNPAAERHECALHVAFHIPSLRALDGKPLSAALKEQAGHEYSTALVRDKAVGFRRSLSELREGKRGTQHRLHELQRARRELDEEIQKAGTTLSSYKAEVQNISKALEGSQSDAAAVRSLIGKAERLKSRCLQVQQAILQEREGIAASQSRLAEARERGLFQQEQLLTNAIQKRKLSVVSQQQEYDLAFEQLNRATLEITRVEQALNPLDAQTRRFLQNRKRELDQLIPELGRKIELWEQERFSLELKLKQSKASLDVQDRGIASVQNELFNCERSLATPQDKLRDIWGMVRPDPISVPDQDLAEFVSEWADSISESLGSIKAENEQLKGIVQKAGTEAYDLIVHAKMEALIEQNLALKRENAELNNRSPLEGLKQQEEMLREKVAQMKADIRKTEEKYNYKLEKMKRLTVEQAKELHATLVECEAKKSALEEVRVRQSPAGGRQESRRTDLGIVECLFAVGRALNVEIVGEDSAAVRELTKDILQACKRLGESLEKAERFRKSKEVFMKDYTANTAELEERWAELKHERAQFEASKKDIEKLRDQKERLQAEASHFTTSLDAAMQKRSTLQKQCAQLEQRISVLKETLSAYEASKAKQIDLLQRNRLLAQQESEKRQKVQKETRSAKQSLQKMEGEFQALESQVRSLEASLRSMSDRLREQGIQYSRGLDHQREVQTELGRLNEQIALKQTELSGLISRVEDSRLKEEQARQLTERTGQSEMNRQVSTAQNTLRLLQCQIASSETLIHTQKQELERLKSQCSSCAQKLSNSQRQVAHLTEKLGRLQHLEASKANAIEALALQKRELEAQVQAPRAAYSQDIQTLRGHIEAGEQTLRGLISSIQKYQARYGQAKSVYSSLVKELEALQAKKGAYLRDIQSFDLQRQRLEQRVAALGAEESEALLLLGLSGDRSLEVQRKIKDLCKFAVEADSMRRSLDLNSTSIKPGFSDC